MRKIPILSILACLSVMVADVRAGDLPGDIAFFGMEKMAQQVKRTVFAVQIEGNCQNESKDDDWVSLGSGFFLTRPKDKALLGITCFHVVEQSLADKKILYAGIDTEEGYQRFPCIVDLLDPKKDVCLLRPQRKVGGKEPKIENLVFTVDDFAEPKSLVEGRAVLIPGYPLGLGGTGEKNHPVVRFGIIAQNSGGKVFLIDGVASHGNSGSPVFLLKEGKIAGMITSHVADHIKLFDENRNLTARLPYNAGLGRATVGQVISDSIKEAIK